MADFDLGDRHKDRDNGKGVFAEIGNTAPVEG